VWIGRQIGRQAPGGWVVVEAVVVAVAVVVVVVV
jgi:hypothetical protein